MLEISGINAFYCQAQILDDVSFSVQAGEVVALLGRNGAGKSTTMKTMMGMVKSTAGDVTFAGNSIKNLPSHAICQKGLGYVPEERRIFTELTVMENLGRRIQANGLIRNYLGRLPCTIHVIAD